MGYVLSIHECIGKTPLLKLVHPEIPININVFAKLEYFNPGGSVKDRLGLHLLKTAIETGEISTKGTLIEPTAGNTGIGLALAAIGTDIKVITVVPQKFSVEKQTLMKALGATVINTPTEEGMVGAIKKAQQLLAEIPDSYCPQQFNNEANPLTYYASLGPELFEELNSEIDLFIAGAGTGGTFMGTARYLKEKLPNLQSIIVEPEGSILNGGESGPHRTEGIGMEFLPNYMDQSYFDRIYTISDEAAFQRVRELAHYQGLLVGSSSGSAFEAVIQEAQHASAGTNIVTIFPDGSERYLSTNIYEVEKR